MKTLLNLKKTAVIAAALCSMGAAQASVVDSVNHLLSFSWSYVSGAGTLTGTGTMDFSGFGTSSLTAVTTLNNTSATTSNRLTSFGFGIDPNASGVTFSDAADGGMVGATLANIPSLETIEVCAFAGNNCSGGGSGGINGGASDSFTVLLASLQNTLWGTSIDINPIGFKYQTSGISYEFTITPPPTGQCGQPGQIPCDTPLPEPGSISLIGLALLGLGVGSIRRRKAK